MARDTNFKHTSKIRAVPCSDYKIYGVGRGATKFILIAHADTIKTC